MEVVSADRLTKKIVHEYFTKLDHDTQQDLFNYIRNFITDEQEKLLQKYEIERESKHKQDSSDDDSDSDVVSNTSDVVEDSDKVEEVPRDMTPYDMETVDIITVYLHVRELYESTIKTPGFVSFWNFYNALFPSRN